MARPIRKFADGSRLEYDQGSFDHWCIYHILPTGNSSAIEDINIFKDLDQLSIRLEAHQLYRDFVSIYEKTDANFSADVLQLISDLAGKYSEFQEQADFLLTSLYAGMVAEENKANAKLRKRIKRLGVHQLLVEERPAEYAANFSRGKKAPDLIIECQVRGF